MASPKKTLGGRYTLLERVGSGGMAEVFRARDELLGREVAVKVLNPKFARDSQFIARFKREAQSAANLNHPNIVSLYDFGSEGSTHYIVMELIDGRSLDELVRADGPLMPERAAEIASDVAAALDRAHQAGIVHRDIKPSNILITSAGETKVADFGIARAMTDAGDQTMTQTGMVIGTASYLSPEQAQGEKLDPRSDVYSLGCVLFEMLTARPPFTGETPLAIAYKHVREAPLRPSAVHPNVPRDLDAITLKGLAKNPANRYASAAEMREDLERFLHGRKVLATPLVGDETTVGRAASGTAVMHETELYEDTTRRGGAYLLVAIGILVLFGILALLFATGTIGGKEVEVPSVVGKDADRAEQILEDAGFETERDPRPNVAPEGEVVAQDPKAGTSLREGETVVITVSTGPEPVPVPDVVGLQLNEAKETLRREGLKVGIIREEASDDFEKGEVIDQSPDAEQIVPTGAEVSLTVSSGKETVTVPSVVGSPEDVAVDQLEGLEFEVSVLTAPDDAEEGTVIAQDPEPLTEAPKGSTVTITVSEGPEEQEMPDVRGMDADDAQTLLEDDYGLEVSRQDTACGDAQPPGTVCDQDPPPGTPVAQGDSATLFVQFGEAHVDPGWAMPFFFGPPLIRRRPRTRS